LLNENITNIGIYHPCRKWFMLSGVEACYALLINSSFDYAQDEVKIVFGQPIFKK